ncbi:hypothetical protein DSM112329_03212 [Paraconexibacter sp. AEG42_29]|uniref:YgjP-like metallopeptidase domain-containing protein n=1 Tax=Paraconexibacter sp. AEG42_29 TaxID=2997339 RepID=A0AAU7AXH0_9ACTN
MSESLIVDGLTFSVARSDRRKTTAIAIERDGTLVLQAPTDLDDADLADAARSRVEWVHRKLAERLLRADLADKAFVAGASFRYLGRTYRLTFTGDLDGVVCKDGRLHVPTHDRADAEKMLRDWYSSRGRAWLPARLGPWCDRLGIDPVEIKVLDLGYRWASMSTNDVMNIHWQAMSLPPKMIDYLFVHELAHLDHPTHDRAFWRAVLRVMPDADDRRAWLRRNASGW